MPPERIAARVFLPEQITDADADLLIAECASVGISAELQILAPRRSLSDAAWLLLVSLPLQHFFGRLAENAADDVHERLRSFANQVLRRTPKKPARRVLVLEDARTGVQVVLEPDLPAESYRQLLSYDMTMVEQGALHYDRHCRRWRSELDEQDPPATPSIPG